MRRSIGVIAVSATALAIAFLSREKEAAIPLSHPALRHQAVQAVQGSDPQANSEPRTPADPSEELLERAKEIANRDLAAAFALIEVEGLPDHRARMRIRLAKAVICNDPSALSAALAFLPYRDRGSNVRWLAKEAVKTNGAGALAAIEAQLSGEMRTNALSGAIEQLASQRDFSLAIAKQREISSSGVGSTSFHNLARELSRANLPALVNWIQTLPKEEAERAIRTAHSALAEERDDAALQTLLPLTADGMIRNNLIQSLIKIQVDRGDTSEAQRFQATMVAADREIGAGAVLIASKDVPLDVAIPQAIEFEDRAAFYTTISGLIQRECAVDIERVAEYALRAPEAAEDAIIHTLVQVWNREDSAQLDEWINQLPNDRIRDKSLKHLSNSLRNSGPVSRARARDVAERIRDPDLRSESIRQLSQ